MSTKYNIFLGVLLILTKNLTDFNPPNLNSITRMALIYLYRVLHTFGQKTAHITAIARTYIYFCDKKQDCKCFQAQSQGLPIGLVLKVMTLRKNEKNILVASKCMVDYFLKILTCNISTWSMLKILLTL